MFMIAAILANTKEGERRLDSVRLMAHNRWSSAEPVLTKLLHNDPNPEIRLAAVRSLAAHVRPEVAELLMKSANLHSRGTP